MTKLHTVLLGGVSVIAVGALCLPAIAQDNSIETVTVTGIRASLQSAQAIKQNSDVFVDSVSAEDIGALPDRSVVESIQRIPGVAINKFLASADPDHFSAEGSGVVVRGLTYVRSELNGTDTFSANNGRELGFADVPSELLVGVDVFKSPSADMIEGGIAGTVNLRTRVPFDAPGRVIAGSIEDGYSDFLKRGTPSASALFSDRWKTKIGEVGFLVDAVYQRTDNRSDSIQADYFVCHGGLNSGKNTCPTSTQNPSGAPGGWFPSGANIGTQKFDRQRMGLGGAAQWQSNDGTMIATLNFLRSDTRETWGEDRVEIASDVVNQASSGAQPVAGTTFGFNNDGVFTNGTITGQTGWRADGNYDWTQNNCSDSPCDPRTPYWGLQSNNHDRNVNARYITQNFGGNFKWTPDDHWAVNLDAQRVDSGTRSIDFESNVSTYQSVAMDLRGETPSVQFLPPAAPNGTPYGIDPCLPGGGPGIAPRPQPNHGATYDAATTCTTFMGYGHTGFSDPYNSFWRSAMDHTENSSGHEWALKGDVDYRTNDWGWIKMVRAGYRWSERDQITRSSLYNWGVLSEQWGQGGPVWLSDPVDGTPNGSGGTLGTPVGGGSPLTADIKAVSFPNFFRGETKNPVPQPYLFGNINGARNYQALATMASLVEHEWNPNTPNGGGNGWVPLGMRPGVCDNNGMVGGVKMPGCLPGYQPGEVRPATEDSHAAYIMVKFGQELAGNHSIDGNIGLRWIHTSHSTIGALQFPTDTLPVNVVGAVNSCLPPASAPPGSPPFQPAAFCYLPPDEQTAAHNFANGSFVVQHAKSSYDYFLPSLNVKFNLQDDMLIRFGFSRSISRPPMGQTALSYNVGYGTNGSPPSGCTPIPSQACAGTWGGFSTAIQNGNPYLKPVRATNFDLSYEWYFGPSNSLTGAVFYKELHGVITQALTDVNVTNASSGATQQVLVTTVVNSDSVGKVKGFELAYQQFFDFLPKPFDGLGINANVTFIESSGVAQNIFNLSPTGGTQIAAVDLSKLPLEQLSKWNYNITGIYQKGQFEARIAYTWRSRFLLTAYDVIVPHSPILNDATGQLDASVFYSINDHFKVGIEGSNLLDTVTKTEQVLGVAPLLTAPRAWYMTDRRVTASLRFNL